MTHSLLEAVTVGADSARYSIIWLHGLGADGHDFEPIVPELDFRQKSETRFIFPHAPSRPISLNQGYVMPAWYDIIAINDRARQDEEGIRASAEEISRLIRREQERGVASERIVLAGFSQGGAIALHLGLRYPQPLAGVMALSTYLPLADKLDAELSGINAKTPIYMAHGQSDPVVPIELAQKSKQRLFDLGCAVDWHVYPMEHSVIPQEITDISHWLEGVLV